MKAVGWARDVVNAIWEETSAAEPPRRVWHDWALIAVLVPVAVLEGIFRPDLPWRIASLIVAVGFVPTLLWRRTRPLLMVEIVFGTTTLMSLSALIVGSDPPGLYTMAYVVLLIYALVRWGSRRDAAIGLPIILASAVVSTVGDYTGPGDTIAGFAFLFGVLALGEAMRYRANAQAGRLEHIKSLGREQLARDLHDTVAHHVSAIAIRAQAGLALSATEPGAATDALRIIAAEASRTLAEMRSMIRVLRRGDEAADLSPTPLVADLHQLTAGGTGPTVDVEISGNVDDLAPPVSTAIYRLAQESVTNARRHARHASRITVSVTADARSVRLRVSDNGDTTHLRPGTAPGYGLVGMTERADLLGGSLTAGPGPTRGWTVTAVLPTDGSTS